MRKSVTVAAISLAVAVALPASAQTPSVVETSKPGSVAMAQTVTAQATIKAVNAATRELTLVTGKGHEFTAVAGPEVVKFDQLKAGDKVDVKYVEALAVELHKGGGKAVGRTDTAMADRGAAGAAPGGVAARKVTVVGNVIGVDPATQMVTVKGPKRTIEFAVKDPEQFKLIAKGDQIEATYVEAVAIAVTPQAAKK
jgi:hypothetical protein